MTPTAFARVCTPAYDWQIFEFTLFTLGLYL